MATLGSTFAVHSANDPSGLIQYHICTTPMATLQPGPLSSAPRHLPMHSWDMSQCGYIPALFRSMHCSSYTNLSHLGILTHFFCYRECAHLMLSNLNGYRIDLPSVSLAPLEVYTHSRGTQGTQEIKNKDGDASLRSSFYFRNSRHYLKNETKIIWSRFAFTSEFLR